MQVGQCSIEVKTKRKPQVLASIIVILMFLGICWIFVFALSEWMVGF